MLQILLFLIIPLCVFRVATEESTTNPMDLFTINETSTEFILRSETFSTLNDKFESTDSEEAFKTEETENYDAKQGAKELIEWQKLQRLEYWKFKNDTSIRKFQLPIFPVEAFVNPEDAVVVKVKPRSDENVERVRRAHLNDLENIPLFFVISFIYILTNPTLAWALLLFRIYTIARILHTIVYAVVVVPQPARGLTWGAGFAITGYMAIQSLLYFK